MDKKITIVVAVIVALVLGAMIFTSRSVNQSGDSSIGSAVNSDLLTTSSETLVTVGSPSSTLLAANTNRKYVKCFNRESAGNNAWVSFGATASVGGGLYLTASSSFTITGDNLYTGIITARNRTGTEVGGTTASSSVRILCQQLSL